MDRFWKYGQSIDYNSGNMVSQLTIFQVNATARVIRNPKGHFRQVFMGFPNVRAET